MKKLLGLLILASSLTSYGQSGPAADTTRCYIDNTVKFEWGTLRLVDGREIQAYLPVFTMYPGIDFPFNYYAVCPNRKPLPPHQTARVAEVLSMTAGPYYFETMRLPGEKKAKILAERVVNGPAELFLQAEQQRIPLAVPVPGAMLHTAIPYTNSHFFLRVNGKLKEVRRDIFERQISTYLEACPELAQKVARGNKGYHYRNMISIVTEYNAYLQAQSASPGN